MNSFGFSFKFTKLLWFSMVQELKKLLLGKMVISCMFGGLLRWIPKCWGRALPKCPNPRAQKAFFKTSNNLANHLFGAIEQMRNSHTCMLMLFWSAHTSCSLCSWWRKGLQKALERPSKGPQKAFKRLSKGPRGLGGSAYTGPYQAQGLIRP